MKYYNFMEKDYHSPFMVCKQSIMWNVNEFIAITKSSGYIVQNVKLTSLGSNDYLLDKSYYEAWFVDQNQTNNNEEEYCDTFCIGHSLSIETEIKESLGKQGRIVFSADVYWIPVESPLFKVVDCWNEGRVKEAGNLKSSNTFNELHNNPSYFVFSRYDFVHEWNLTKIKDVYKYVLEYFQRKYPKEHIVRDVLKMQFNDEINYILNNDVYSKIKSKINKNMKYISE